MAAWDLPNSGASESINIEPEGDMQGSQFNIERNLPSYRKGNKNYVLWLAP